MTQQVQSPAWANRIVAAANKKPLPPRILLYGAAGIGKAQPLDAGILTDVGFVDMASIEVGDYVYGSAGELVRVTGVYPRGMLDVFRVTMSDGTQTECCDEHLWATERAEDGVRAVRPLSEIRETLTHRNGERRNHRVPMTAPVNFPRMRLPLHPYLLGLLLGDGSLNAGPGKSVTFHKPEEDIIDRLESLLPDSDTVTRFTSSGMLSARIIQKKRPGMGHGNNRGYGSTTWLSLLEMGLIGTNSLTKFIPVSYLAGTPSDRLELLRGLCDTDGSVRESGRSVEFATSSQRLRDDVLYLARSLGARVTHTERVPRYSYLGEKRDGAVSYRLSIMCGEDPLFCPVSSKKNLSKWKPQTDKQYRTIESIEFIGQKECQCITVDSQDGLYVTDDFIVTHNSTFAASMPKPVLIDFDKGADEIKVDMIPGPSSWDETMGLIREIGNSPGDYRTLVVDTVDVLEEMAQVHVAQQAGKSFQALNDEYGAGHLAVGMVWKLFLNELDEVRKKGIHIVLLGHAVVRSAIDPSIGSFDQWTSQLGKKPWLLCQRWSDIVAFAAFDASRVAKEDRAIVTGQRLMYVVRGTGYEAKNRYSLPTKMPLSWRDLASGIEKHRHSAEELKAKIRATAHSAGLGERVEAYITQCNDDLGQLTQLRTQLEQAVTARLAAQTQVTAQVAPAPAPVPAPEQLVGGARIERSEAPPVQAASPPPAAPSAPPVPATQPQKQQEMTPVVTAPADPDRAAFAIEQRIRALVANADKALATKVMGYIAECKSDLVKLGALESQLKAKLGQATPSQASPPNGAGA